MHREGAPRRVADVVVYTVGHSTRSADEFVDLLRAHGIERLVDVRTVPRSRRHPWTSVDELPRVLAPHGIAHAHAPALGGLRKPKPDSENAAWRNASFRGYADHMQSDAFQRAVDALVEAAARERVAIMCAEAVPWRCHRSLIADALAARGVEARHIMDERTANAHRLTPFARVEGARVTYPPEGGAQSKLPLE